MKRFTLACMLCLTGLAGMGGCQLAAAAPGPPTAANESSPKTAPKGTTLSEKTTEPDAAASETPSAQSSCTCDPAERQLLSRLRERRMQLDERERAIVTHEAVLGRIETELAGRLQAIVADVQRMEEHVKPALLAKQSHDREKADALLNALSTLPARKASAIIAKAEPEIAAMLLGQLGPEKSAGILAVMEPATAAALVQRLVKPAAKGSDTTAEAGTNNAKSRSGTENP